MQEDRFAQATEGMVDAAVLAALERMPKGHGEGRYGGRRWGVTRTVSPDGRRVWLFGEELGGTDRVSFNLYRLARGAALRPCEMPAAAVIAFVLGYVPDAGSGSTTRGTSTGGGARSSDQPVGR